MNQALMQSEIPGLAVRRGKVRDVYELDGERLLIVASDRISAFDVIMPNGIPGKGKVLTGLSNFWFGMFGRVEGFRPWLRTHLLEGEAGKLPVGLAGYGEQLAGRSVVVKRTEVLPIECVVRGYLAGSGWKDYQKTGMVSGVKLPKGLRLSERLPEAIFTPSTKASVGHDEPISFEETCGVIGEELAGQIKRMSLALYEEARAYAEKRGILIADTKFEFGTRSDVSGGKAAILIDEALTPDSSRFWPADAYEVGREQASFDKQYVRNYLETLAWGKTAPGPELPEEVVRGTLRKYLEAYERITGNVFSA